MSGQIIVKKGEQRGQITKNAGMPIYKFRNSEKNPKFLQKSKKIKVIKGYTVRIMRSRRTASKLLTQSKVKQYPDHSLRIVPFFIA
jgi:hypothetical protein